MTVRLADAHSDRILISLQNQLDAEFERLSGSMGRGEEVETQKIQWAFEWMQRHPLAGSPVASLADYLGVSVMTLSRLFRKTFQKSPGEVLRDMKLQQAREKLLISNMSVKRIALDLGYGHVGDFTRAFHRKYHESPSVFRRKSLQELEKH